LMKSGEPIAPPEISSTEEHPVALLPESYSVLLKNCIQTVFHSFPALPNETRQAMSMLTARLLASQEDWFYLLLQKFLTTFISFFSGFTVAASEAYYHLEKEYCYLNGIVDCILESPADPSSEEKTLVIIDFKTKNMPKRANYTGEEGLTDFQLPEYLRLAEASIEKEVHVALFFSIIDPQPMVLFGSLKNLVDGKNHPYRKNDTIIHGDENYIRIMNEFDEKAEQFARDILQLNFPIYPEHSSHCQDCEYNKVCRTLYKVYQGSRTGN